MHQPKITERLIKRLFPMTYYLIKHNASRQELDNVLSRLEDGRPVFTKFGDRWYQIKRHRTNKANVKKLLDADINKRFNSTQQHKPIFVKVDVDRVVE